MDINVAEKWLLNESEKGNTLASSYMKLLKDASPEIRSHWMQQLATMLETVDLIMPQIEKMNRMEK